MSNAPMLSEKISENLNAYEKRNLSVAAQWFDEESKGRFSQDSPGTDGPAIPKDEKLLILCMTPRSGSTALSAAMAASGLMGRGGERLQRKPGGPLAKFIHEGATSLSGAFDQTIKEAATPNGVSQIKSDFAQLYPFLMDPKCRQRIGHAKFVYLTRLDVLGQAISRYKGFRTGFWHSDQDAGKAPPEAEYDFEGINQQILFLSLMMAAYERMFASLGLAPLRITYEQVVADAGAVVHDIAEYIGVEITEEFTLSDSGHKRVATKGNEEMRDRFLSDFSKLTQ